MAQTPSTTNVGRLPDHMKHSARDYVDRGVRPGGFLRAVLENKFSEAVGQADEANRAHLVEWNKWLFNDIPANAWGSEEAVEEWVEQGGKAGR